MKSLQLFFNPANDSALLLGLSHLGLMLHQRGQSNRTSNWKTSTIKGSVGKTETGKRDSDGKVEAWRC